MRLITETLWRVNTYRLKRVTREMSGGKMFVKRLSNVLTIAFRSESR